MVCPRCDSELVERERAGITIDFCSSCRGVWLDRGELENLVSGEQNFYDDRDQRRANRRDHNDDDDDNGGGGGGFLQNIMDLIGGGN